MVKRIGMVLVVAVVGLLGASACSGTGAGASGLPTLAPTVTAVAPATPTDIPDFEPVQLPKVDWNDVDRFRAAMRPAFAGDIDAFVDRNRYYIEASLVFEDNTAIIRGAERVRYTNHSPDTLDQIVFRLYANLPALGGRMKIYRAFLNDAPIEPGLTERDSVLVIPLDTPLKPGQSVEIMLEFSTAAERGFNASYGQFGFQDNVFSGPEWYPMLSVYETGTGWWMTRPTPQGDAVYSETGLYEILLTLPESFILAMSGSEIDQYPGAEEGTIVHHYVSGPMRDSLLVAGPDLGKITEYVDDIAINVLYWPGGERAAEWVLGISVDSVRTYNENFGPYPFTELDVAETFNYTGIEYPGIIVLADRNWERGNQFLEITTAHEIAHQWWYSMVGNNQVEKPWLDESLTSYSEYVYMREVHNEEYARDAIQGDRDWYNYYRSTGAPDLVLDLPVSSYMDNNYGVIIYVKGPLFYTELERLLGREKFLDAVQLYFKKNRYEVVRSRDVLDAFEEATGEDLDAVFYQWVGNFPGLDPAVVEEMQSTQQ